MGNVRLSDLPKKNTVSLEDERLVLDVSGRATMKIKVAALSSIMDLVLTSPCKYCGSRGRYDLRGNCSACGAPVGDKLE